MSADNSDGLRYRGKGATKTEQETSKNQQLQVVPQTKKTSSSACCLYVVVFLVGMLLIFAGFLSFIYISKGTGPPFPDRSTSKTVKSSNELEIVAELPSPPGNLAVSADGRLIFSFHDFAPAPPFKVAEWNFEKKTYSAFPNEEWQNSPGHNGDYFRAVLSVRIDQSNKLWALDNANLGFGGTPTIYAFDLNQDGSPLVYKHEFESHVCSYGCMLNDMQISPRGDWVYITNSAMFGDPSLIVLDVKERKSRRVLSGSHLTQSEGYLTTINGVPLNLFHVFNFQATVDSIGLDQQGEWLYFSATNALKLYRIRTEDLINDEITDSELEDEIEAFSDKSVSDGLSVDGMGNVYVTDFEHFEISIIDQVQRKSISYIRDKNLLRWPDGLSFGPNGWLYMSCSDLIDVVYNMNTFGGSESFSNNYGPFHIVRVQTNQKARPGQ